MPGPIAINRILVPLDGSDQATQVLPFVRQIAARETRVILMAVTPDPRPVHDPLAPALRGPAPLELRGEPPEPPFLTATADAFRLENPDLEVFTLAVSGDPSEAIVRTAAGLPVDLIAMTSAGRGAIGRMAFGSTADRVSRTADVPVIVVRGQTTDQPETPALSRIVVPLDGSDLSMQALPLAVHFALQLEASIYLICVVDPTKGSSAALAYASAFSESLFQELSESAEAEATAMLREAAQQTRAAGVETDWLVTAGSPARAITEMLVPGDLVVITSHGRGGIERWMIGSTAEKLLRQGTAPVTIVRAVEGPKRA